MGFTTTQAFRCVAALQSSQGSIELLPLADNQPGVVFRQGEVRMGLELLHGTLWRWAIDQHDHAQVLERLGADLVILPTRDTAYRLAERIQLESLKDRMPLFGEYQLAHLRVGYWLSGQTLWEAKFPSVLAVGFGWISPIGGAVIHEAGALAAEIEKRT